jgi:esterase/lipase superfamily enzyme
VAAELWHYLGYHGVMLAYAWPSTPRTLAYSGDLETAQYSSQNLRYLLQFLARETTAERIHIVAYSAGTRVAVDAVRDLGLIYSHESQEKIFEELKIEDLILLGSDMDRHIIRSYARDGMLDVARHLSIYASKKDGAMTMSKFVFGYYRIGDLRNNDQLTTETVEYMRRHPSAIIIDVTCAENAKKGSGHGYFLASPWVSSDIFITLLRGLPPQDRGLIQGKDDAIWSFPSDYEERLKALAREAKQKKDRDGTRAGLNK